jgi:hypothetical protein
MVSLEGEDTLELYAVDDPVLFKKVKVGDHITVRYQEISEQIWNYRHRKSYKKVVTSSTDVIGHKYVGYRCD